MKEAPRRPAIFRARAKDSSRGTPLTLPVRISSRRRCISVFQESSISDSIPPWRASNMRSISSATVSGGSWLVSSTISSRVIGMGEHYDSLVDLSIFGFRVLGGLWPIQSRLWFQGVINGRFQVQCAAFAPFAVEDIVRHKAVKLFECCIVRDAFRGGKGQGQCFAHAGSGAIQAHCFRTEPFTSA